MGAPSPGLATQHLCPSEMQTTPTPPLVSSISSTTLVVSSSSSSFVKGWISFLVTQRSRILSTHGFIAFRSVLWLLCREEDQFSASCVFCPKRGRLKDALVNRWLDLFSMVSSWCMNIGVPVPLLISLEVTWDGYLCYIVGSVASGMYSPAIDGGSMVLSWG